MVKEFLSQKGIGFKDIDVSRDQSAAQELISRTGQRAVPVIVIDGQTVIGFNRAQLEQALSQAQAGGHPTFGAAIADASKITAQQGLTALLGAYVGKVRPGSAAEKIGLALGDIITELNGQNITSADELERALAKLNKGSRLSLAFLRGNKTLTGEGTL